MRLLRVHVDIRNNAAVAASRVANRGKVGVVARVGEDFNRRKYTLTRRGIDIGGISVIRNGKTAIINIIENEDNTRSFKVDLGVVEQVDVGIFPKNYLYAKYVHLATSYPSKYLKWLVYLRNVLGQETVISADAVDLSTPEVINEMEMVFKQVDLVFINVEELHNIQCNNPNFMFDKPTVIKRGKIGASYFDKKNSIEINIKAPKVVVVDTTGAGDTLAGVFLARLSSGISIKQSLQDAVGIASKTVTDFGVEHLNPIR